MRTAAPFSPPRPSRAHAEVVAPRTLSPRARSEWRTCSACPVGPHDRERGFQPRRPAQVDRLGQLGELGVDEWREGIEATLLGGVVAREPAECRRVGGEGIERAMSRNLRSSSRWGEH